MYTNLFDAEARVAAIYSIDLIGDAENPPKWVEEFADNLDNEYIGAIVDEMPELQPIRDPEAYFNEKDHAKAIAEEWALAGRYGFIAHFEVCMRRYSKDGSDTFFSGWSYVALCWAYADTVDEIHGKVLAAATAIHDAAKARATARISDPDMAGVRP